MNLEDEIKDALGFRKLKKVEGQTGGGCINSGQVYEVDDDRKIYVKICDKNNSAEVMAGEYESLKSIMATETTRVPEPMRVVFDPDQENTNRTVLVMEHIEMTPLTKYQGELGTQLANLHLHNEQLDEKRKYNNSYLGQSVNNDENKIVVEQFGFDVVTCCGSLPMLNEWEDDWVSFYSRHRLDHQIRMIEDNFGDREISKLWSELQLVIPKFFRVFSEEEAELKPSLLHGDLWSGNSAETDECPVIFDPCCFYGHSEYDLAIGQMFGGFEKEFHQQYHSIRKKVKGQDDRIELYQLFHYLNHWNHFGSSYRSKTIDLMRKLTKI
ncbi:Ketosamine-3-kinase [Halotydeus destructor]|nr:Ketosamine-3-kinase [Halotydeus destructor]